MKTYLFVILNIIALTTFSQNFKPKHHFQISAGRNFHGTGDTRGFVFNTEYGKNLRKKIAYHIAIGGTINDGFSPIFYNDRDGNLIDASVRYTTAGFQLTGLGSYSLIRTDENDLMIRVGPLLRYQSSSLWDSFANYYPSITGLPFPVVVFENKTPQRTYAFGGAVQLGYNYTFNKKISIGILGSFQIDTNGDVLRQTSLTVGRRF